MVQADPWGRALPRAGAADIRSPASGAARSKRWPRPAGGIASMTGRRTTVLFDLRIAGRTALGRSASVFSPRLAAAGRGLWLGTAPAE